MGNPLAEVLNRHLAARDTSIVKLAEATGISRKTIFRWTTTGAGRVHLWQALVKIARALDLNRAQTNELLVAGGKPTLDNLELLPLNDEDRALLDRWATTPPNNLPQHLTSFVGREEEIARIAHLLASARLVTLTGPGGSGKTRLALEAAQALLDQFDGVTFVDLAAVRDPNLVILTICQALGLTEFPDEPPLAALINHLRERTTLLILDNFEQVVDAAPLVSTVLQATRQVKALVTSRTRLDIRGEHEVIVAPLPLLGPGAGFDALARNPAVVLFANRSVAVDPAFTLTPENAPLVAGICAHLEGLPLGIELAAAKTRQVGLRSMLERFPSRLDLVSGGPRDLADRQRTLRATIAWSHDLLSPGDQHLFTVIGVFAKGFTGEAATAVCAGSGRDATDPEAGLESLADQSLLRRVPDAGTGTRYEMLETIREDALERLQAAGVDQAARRAHAGYYLDLVERADLQGEGQPAWLDRLSADHDNIGTALAWCRDDHQGEMGLRLCVALMPYWQLRDHRFEARGWLETFMAVSGNLPPHLRARGLLWQGLLLMRGTGDISAPSRLFEEALAMFRDEGDLKGASEALQAFGDAYRQSGEWGRAKTHYQESLELAERSGDAFLVAHGYMGLAFCAQEEGQFDAAQDSWESTLEWALKAGNAATVTMALNSLGEMARSRSDWDRATDYYEQTLTLAREMGSAFWTALARHNLGYAALYSGNPTRAKDLFAESFVLYQGLQYRKGEAECLAGLARVEALDGSLERAARLCGASEAALKETQSHLDTLDRADFERTLATLRSGLVDRLQPLLDEGRSMSRATAAEYASPGAIGGSSLASPVHQARSRNR